MGRFSRKFQKEQTGYSRTKVKKIRARHLKMKAALQRRVEAAVKEISPRREESERTEGRSSP